MNAIYYDGKLTYRTDLPEPQRAKGEALIKVTLRGICRTDLELTKGYMNFRGVPGHEFVGIVEDADDKTLIGGRVVGDINCGCGECPECRIDDEHHCQNRTVLGILGRDGAFAEKLTLPEKNLHTVPDFISDEEAVFIEPLSAAFRVAEQVKVINNDVLVLGDGKLGLLIAQSLAFLRADVVLCGRHPEKMELIQMANLTTKTADELLPNKKYSVVIEATGSKEGFLTAMERIKPRGKLVIKSTLAEQPYVDLNQIIVDEISIIGSRCGSFEQGIALLEQKGVKVKELIQKTYRLEKGLKAFEEAGKTGALKILLA